jgi:hypothetical protein
MDDEGSKGLGLVGRSKLLDGHERLSDLEECAASVPSVCSDAPTGSLAQ